MASIFDFLSNTAPPIEDAVKDRRLMDWQRYSTQAGDDALRARTAAQELAADRAMGQGKITAERQAANRAAVLTEEAWRRSMGGLTSVGDAAGTVGRGILGAGKALAGPGAQAALYSGDVEAAELSPAQREAKNPGEQADAAAYAQRVQGNAQQANQPPNSPISLMNPNGPTPEMGGGYQMPSLEEAATDVAGTYAAGEAAQEYNAAPAVTPTPAGNAVQAAPANTQQAAATTAQDQESQRQMLEQGALKGLSTGAVSRPKMAEAVVEADLARSGQKLTPEATKAAVTQELGNMKSMDNEDLSRYISYALIAGGLIASFADKSGRTGEAFANSFNKQLDRNLAAGIQTQKALAEQAKLNQELSIQNQKFQRDDRRIDISEKVAEDTSEYRGGLLKQGERKIDLGYQSEGRQAAQGAAGLGLRAQGIQLRQQGLTQAQKNADRDYELNARRVATGEEANTIKAMGAAKKASEAPPGVPLTEKGSKELVKSFADSQGVKLDSSAVAAVASQAQQASKNDPRWATDPNAVMADIINGKGYTVENKTGFPYIGNGPRIKQRKQ
jgi:DNA-binding TFAR19-related protein (PDSD5 family)